VEWFIFIGCLRSKYDSGNMCYGSRTTWNGFDTWDFGKYLGENSNRTRTDMSYFCAIVMALCDLGLGMDGHIGDMDVKQRGISDQV
jgi:hypothetical protein